MPHHTIRRLPFVALALTGSLLAACGGDDTTVQANSTLRLDITDAPLATASRVWLQFTGVEIKQAGAPPRVSCSRPPGGSTC